MGARWVGGIIPRLPRYQNIYREELGGQLGIANFAACVDLPKMKYKIETPCDGLSALNKVGLKVEYIK